MTLETFKTEMARMRSEWNGYGEARCVALWDVFRQVPDEVFRTVVTKLLLDPPKYAPGKKEMEQLVNEEMATWNRKDAGVSYARETGPQDTTPTPDRRRRVHELVRQVTEGRVLPSSDKPNFAERQRRRAEQLRMLSPQDKAAGEKGDE